MFEFGEFDQQSLGEKIEIAKPEHLRHARQVIEQCKIMKAGKSLPENDLVQKDEKIFDENCSILKSLRTIETNENSKFTKF